MCPQGTLHLATGGLQQEMGTPIRKSPFQEKGKENPEDNPLGPLPPPLNEDVQCLINTLGTRLQLSTPQKTHSLVKPCQERQNFLLNNGTIRNNVLKTTIQNWWSGRAVRLLKRAVADMAWYMGPTTSITHILQKLTVILGRVVSFDVLMQNFYKVTQSNHKKVPSFTTRLEGTLNQIRLQCPRMITD